MGRMNGPALAALLAAAIAVGACGQREGTSPLYILEELEAASAVKIPYDRIERLQIFIDNHPEHPYRSLAYERMLATILDTLGDEQGGEEAVREYLRRETDPAVRGTVHLARFVHVLESDRSAAIAIFDTLGATERSPRLFMMIGYYLMDSPESEGKALRAFLRAADLSSGPHEISQAHAMAGTILKNQGKTEEAKKHLEIASAADNPEANRLLGEIYWNEGRREEAIDRYIACVARMPGAREYVKLDSLYALVSPDTGNLDKDIRESRIADEGQMPPAWFVDLEGRRYEFAKFRGTKLVICALSPA